MPAIKSAPTVAQFVNDVKNLMLEIAARATAIAGFARIQADTFKDATGINAGTSSGYTFRGSTNFDVIKATSPILFGNNMTSNVLPVPLVASASSALQPAWKAFDGIEGAGEYWQSSTAGTEWLLLDCGVAKTFTQYKVLGNTAASNSPASWTIQGSNTGAFGGEEVTLDTRTGQSPGGSKQTYTMTTPGSYRYYRMRITAITSSTSYCVQSLEYYEAAPSSADIRQVTLTVPVATTQVILFADVTLNTGSATYYVSTDNGSTWTTVTDLGQIISVPSGTQLVARVVLTGDAELEFLGIASAT